MIYLRRASERGHIKFDWLDAYHTFSFGHYYDPAFMGFKSLRVINEDFIDEGMGFDTHPHRNMEIVTFMVSGSLAHKDSMGNVSTIKPGEIQVMSAGTGIQHSEFNPSPTEKTHSYQIWIQPDKLGVEPRYEQMDYRSNSKINSFIKLLSPDAEDNSIKIYQQLNLWYGKFQAGQKIQLNSSKAGWLQIIKGHLKVSDLTAITSDGIAFEEEKQLNIDVLEDLELLWFEFI